jgi:hypothetical protein
MKFPHTNCILAYTHKKTQPGHTQLLQFWTQHIHFPTWKSCLRDWVEKIQPKRQSIDPWLIYHLSSINNKIYPEKDGLHCKTCGPEGNRQATEDTMEIQRRQILSTWIIWLLTQSVKEHKYILSRLIQTKVRWMRANWRDSLVMLLPEHSYSELSCVDPWATSRATLRGLLWGPQRGTWSLTCSGRHAWERPIADST